MHRSLKVSAQPFIAFAIVIAPVVMILVFVVVKKGFRSDLVIPVALPFLLYAAIMIMICSNRVTVSETGITVVSYFVFRRFVRFGDIDHSDVQILAERDHPAWLALHYREGKKNRTLSMSLKPYRKDDVTWFCALPELKAKTHRGFTKKG